MTIRTAGYRHDTYRHYNKSLVDVGDHNPMDGAACSTIVTKEYDPWFEDDDDKHSPEDKAYARLICESCPIQNTCLDIAMVNHYSYGIWGGLDPSQRAELHPVWVKNRSKSVLSELYALYRNSSVEAFMPGSFGTRSVEAKYTRRLARAQHCQEKLKRLNEEEVFHYTAFMKCVNAVINNPAATGAELGGDVGMSPALFNQRLRECFEYFNLDLSVL